MHCAKGSLLQRRLVRHRIKDAHILDLRPRLDAEGFIHMVDHLIGRVIADGRPAVVHEVEVRVVVASVAVANGDDIVIRPTFSVFLIHGFVIPMLRLPSLSLFVVLFCCRETCFFPLLQSYALVCIPGLFASTAHEYALECVNMFFGLNSPSPMYGQKQYAGRAI